MASSEGVKRYSLILETNDNNRYYFDTELGTFVMMYNDDSKNSTLQKFDFLTSSFANKEELASCYGINSEIKKIYIRYQFKGERLLAPVFNNSNWAHVALTANGTEVNFKDEKNLGLFNEVYDEIINLNSNFTDMILKNEKRLINLSPRTVNTIVGLRAHERAYQMKKDFGFSVNSYETFNKVDSIYRDDKYGFYQDLKKNLSKYREFRTIYLNYCRFTNRQEKTNENDKPKKKVLIPPEQLSFFDENI